MDLLSLFRGLVNLCNILSRGMFSRVMVTAPRSRTVLAHVEISRGREASLPLSSHSTSPANRCFSWVIDELVSVPSDMGLQSRG